MTFDWSYLDREGDEVGRSRRFDEADEAEAWIGSSWPDLLERGIECVELWDHRARRAIYRMGLGEG